MSTEAERLEWYRRGGLLRRGMWSVSLDARWPWSWSPRAFAGWSQHRTGFSVGVSWFGHCVSVTRRYAWFTADGEFVWGALGLKG